MIKMSQIRTIAKNTGFLISSDILSKVISVVFLIYLARVLGDSGLGKYSFIFSFVGIFTLASDLGIVPLIIREIAKDEKKLQRYFYNSLTLRIFSSIFALVLAIIVLVFFERSSEIMLSVFLVSLAMLFYNLSEICFAIFSAFQKMEYPSVMLILERIITVSMGIYALSAGYGIVAIALIYFISYLIIFIISLFLVGSKIIKVRFWMNLDDAKSILKESFPFWLTTIFYTIYFKVNTVMLTFMKGYQQAGWYSAAYSLLESLIFIPVSAGRALFPVMSKFHGVNKPALLLLLRKSIYYLCVLGIAISIGVTLLSDRIIYLIYLDKFQNSVFALQILIWGVMLIFASTIAGNFLNAINKQKVFSMITLVAALVNVVANLILIPLYGYIGAAFGTVITEFLVLIFAIGVIIKNGYNIQLNKIIIKPIIAGILMGIAINYFRHLNLFVVIVLGAVVYFAVLILLRGITKEDIQYFSAIFDKRT